MPCLLKAPKYGFLDVIIPFSSILCGCVINYGSPLGFDLGDLVLEHLFRPFHHASLNALQGLEILSIVWIALVLKMKVIKVL